MFSGFSHIMLYVNDIDRALKWYQENLGFRVNFASPYYASLQLDPINFQLDLHPTEAASKDVGYGPIPYFKVKDINSTIDFLKTKGVKVSEPKKEGKSPSFASFWDSEGNTLGLQEE
jgi:predicted enzyme related to lactoylglutathione lyase